jgi:prophage regulatory protein
MQVTGLGRSSIYKGIKDGTFPAPIVLGRRAVGWIDGTISEWIESRPQAGRSTTASHRSNMAASANEHESLQKQPEASPCTYDAKSAAAERRGPQ